MDPGAAAAPGLLRLPHGVASPKLIIRVIEILRLEALWLAAINGFSDLPSSQTRDHVISER